jgi:hypothetical protein
LFKKPGGFTAARSIWETQSAAALRVGSFQCSVFSQSHGCRIDRSNSFLLIAERRANTAVSSSGFGDLLALFMVSAHRDPTQHVACFENGPSIENVTFVHAHQVP